MQASTGSSKPGEQETSVERQRQRFSRRKCFQCFSMAVMAVMAVFSVLLYGCETWKMTKGEKKKLNISRPSASDESSASAGRSTVTNEEVFLS